MCALRYSFFKRSFSLAGSEDEEGGGGEVDVGDGDGDVVVVVVDCCLGFLCGARGALAGVAAADAGASVPSPALVPAPSPAEEEKA